MSAQARTSQSQERVPPITLTEEFEHALALLHAGANVFLTGRAGTGKSTLIRHFLATTGRKAVTVAPTGIAALNVDGYTIHRLFSFPMGITEDTVGSRGYYPSRFAATLKELEILIVDEASMVRADLFDALVAALERFGPHPGEPCGGVQLVLVGDLHRLPPWCATARWTTSTSATGPRTSSPPAGSTRPRSPWSSLTHVFRQRGDARLVDILNAVREGALLEDARRELNARTDPDFEPPDTEFWLTLATTNRIVRTRNRQMLERLETPRRTYRASVRGDMDGFELPADETLELAEGAQVMLLSNDPLDRWVNGTLGRVDALLDTRDGPLVRVLTRGGDVVDVEPHTWDVTRPTFSGGSLDREVIGTFTQLPMKARVGHHDSQEPGSDARECGGRPHGRHLRQWPPICGPEPLHQPGRPGLEASGPSARPQDGRPYPALPHRRGTVGRCRGGGGVPGRPDRGAGGRPLSPAPRRDRRGHGRRRRGDDRRESHQ
ncbi:hypothetical protein GCM10025876_12690 [Demequina litorisediminis]|uniref:AAA+ ATPase domain-containing protein n=1 Tax=Demequina litorisediminis TaxID=1849022 RepID=A0ABQ6IBA7_9MICO|nr:hypothetical protein GCM10025876_12690 [Demequina litorisediminis]